MAGTAPGHSEPATDTGAPVVGGPNAPRWRSRWWFPPAAVGTALVLVVAALAFVLVHHQQQQQVGDVRVLGLPATVSTNLMGLSPLPAKAAPGFTLTDQNGRTFPLSSFRGKVVVLEAMDPHCVDICPIVSQEFVDAYHDLGRAAPNVVFAALNVNQYYAGVKDVRAFSQDHNLTSIPSWHFFTGPVPSLKAAWKAYDIQVEAPNPNADILHTSIIYFIDPRGVERYVASPMVDHTASGKTYLPTGPLAAWGQAIARTAKDLAA